MRAAVGAVPVIGTTRVVDLAAAERLVASGDADAVGMTRALIADPDLVAKARARPDRRGARLHRLQPGLHRPLPRGRADRLPGQPAHRARADAAAPGRRRSGGCAVAVVGAGPGGRRRRGRGGGARRRGDAVRARRRHRRPAAARRPRARPPRAVAALARRTPRGQLARAGIAVRLGEEAGAGRPRRGRRRRARHRARARTCPTGRATRGRRRRAVRDRPRRRPGRASTPGPRSPTPPRSPGPVLVADWGGGWDGLDAAEVLAEQGLEVTLACAAPCPGDTLHQYQRNLYLARFDAARDRDPAPHRGDRRRPAPPLLRPRRARSRRWRRSSTPRAASPRTGSGPRWRASRAGSARATCSARARRRRRRWRA